MLAHCRTKRNPQNQTPRMRFQNVSFYNNNYRRYTINIYTEQKDSVRISIVEIACYTYIRRTVRAIAQKKAGTITRPGIKIYYYVLVLANNYQWYL